MYFIVGLKPLVMISLLPFIVFAVACTSTRKVEVDRSKGLTQSSIAQVMAYNEDEMSSCYEDFLVNYPDATAQIEVEISIGSQGRVENLKYLSSNIRDKKMELCIDTKLKQLVFPKPLGGETAVVKYPILFAPL